jgi:ANTAR domain
VVDVTDWRHVATGEQDALRPLYDGLAGVVAEIAGAESLVDGCTSLAAFGVRHLGADVAGVSRLPRRGALEMLAATDPVVARVGSGGEDQETAAVPSSPVGGEVHALRGEGDSHPSRVLPSEAARLGFRSALLIGLPAFSSGAVVLELYSRTPSAFDAVSPGITAHVTALAGTALRDLERRTNLQEALHTRGVIGQAQGILMERYALTGEQAMGYLRRHSQETQQPVRVLAAEVVGRREAESLARAERDGLG